MGMKIARGLFSLWIVALAVSLDNVHATNQHMICKTVKNVFNDEAAGPNYSRRHALQGPAGKKGPPGVKGEPGLPGSKGERGIPSTFNPADVENMMETKIRAATKELRDRIEILETKVTELNSTSPSEHQSAGGTGVLMEKKVTELNSTSTSEHQSAGDPPEETQCEDGIIYRQKCYFVPFVHSGGDVPFTNAQDICERDHGKLADILDREHQRLITNYVRAKIPSSQTFAYVWLDMLYQVSTKSLQWSDGTIVDASLNWRSGYPRYHSTYTNVCISVYKDTTATSNGVFNFIPTYSMHGAVCEK